MRGFYQRLGFREGSTTECASSPSHVHFAIDKLFTICEREREKNKIKLCASFYNYLQIS